MASNWWWPTVPAWIYGNPGYLTHPSSKLTEMLAPTNQPTRMVQWQGRGSLGAWRRSASLGLTASGPPVLTDPSGQPISSAVCGSPYGFTVPGYEGAQVYIIQTKNGQPQYSGLFSVPMAPYTGVCGQDEGTYQLTAYDPTSGQSLGQVQFQVLPAGSHPGVTRPPVPGAHVTGAFNLSTTQIVIVAAAAYFLLLRRRSS